MRKRPMRKNLLFSCHEIPAPCPRFLFWVLMHVDLLLRLVAAILWPWGKWSEDESHPLRRESGNMKSGQVLDGSIERQTRTGLTSVGYFVKWDHEMLLLVNQFLVRHSDTCSQMHVDWHSGWITGTHDKWERERVIWSPSQQVSIFRTFWVRFTRTRVKEQGLEV